MRERSFKAVIFDMDGVMIIDSHSISQQLHLELGERQRIDLDPENIRI